MKKTIQETVMVERSFCNICDEEIIKEPFNKERIAFIRGLFSIIDFDAHEVCINKIAREAFVPFMTNNK